MNAIVSLYTLRHVSLSVRLRMVRILVVRSLPVSRSARPQVRILPMPLVLGVLVTFNCN